MERPIPDFYIGQEKANMMIKHFQQFRLPWLNQQLTPPQTDTCSLWYSFQHIEELYNELVYLKADGLRIYMGAYPENTFIQNEINISNQLCPIMVPTRYNYETLKYEDVILEETEGFSNRLGSERYIGQSGNNTELSRGFDEGKPCPPLCDEQGMRFPL